MSRTRNKSAEGIGAQVRAVRYAAGLTQTELAERIGSQQETISRIESGSSGVGLGMLRRLAQALDATWQFDGRRLQFRTVEAGR